MTAYILIGLGVIVSLVAVMTLVKPEKYGHPDLSRKAIKGFLVTGIALVVIGYNLTLDLEHQEQIAIAAEQKAAKTAKLNDSGCDDIRIEVSEHDLGRIELAWGKSLARHQQSLELIFKRAQPENYQEFSQAKVETWLPEFDENRDRINCYWSQFGRPMDSLHQDVRNIVVAMADMNTVSIRMQSYLRHKQAADLNFIQSKLAEVSLVSEKYSID